MIIGFTNYCLHYQNVNIVRLSNQMILNLGKILQCKATMQCLHGWQWELWELWLNSVVLDIEPNPWIWIFGSAYQTQMIPNWKHFSTYKIITLSQWCLFIGILVCVGDTASFDESSLSSTGLLKKLEKWWNGVNFVDWGRDSEKKSDANTRAHGASPERKVVVMVASSFAVPCCLWSKSVSHIIWLVLLLQWFSHNWWTLVSMLMLMVSLTYKWFIKLKELKEKKQYISVWWTNQVVHLFCWEPYFILHIILIYDD